MCQLPPANLTPSGSHHSSKKLFFSLGKFSLLSVRHSSYVYVFSSVVSLGLAMLRSPVGFKLVKRGNWINDWEFPQSRPLWVLGFMRIPLSEVLYSLLSTPTSSYAQVHLFLHERVWVLTPTTPISCFYGALLHPKPLDFYFPHSTSHLRALLCLPWR